MESWEHYYQAFKTLDLNDIELPFIPDYTEHNAYQFHLRLKNEKIRDLLKENLKENNIASEFHFIPLHNSQYGRKAGKFYGSDFNTIDQSQRILRLPLGNVLNIESQQMCVNVICNYFKTKNNSHQQYSANCI